MEDKYSQKGSSQRSNGNNPPPPPPGGLKPRELHEGYTRDQSNERNNSKTERR